MRSRRSPGSPLRRMGLLPQYRRGLSSPLRRGGTIPGPAKMQFSWVVSVPGWFNPHRPYCGQHPPRDENAPMPTAPGPRATCRVGGIRAGGVVQSTTGGGMSPEALAKGKIRVTKTPHRGAFYSASSSDNASPPSDSDAAMLSGVAGIKSACACNLTIARTISIARCNW